MMAEKSLLVLVAGATGRQGGSVARHLRDRGHRLRAVVRNPQAPNALALRRQGVEVFQGSMEDGAAVARAAQDVDAFFLMTTPFELGPPAEVRQGITAVEAAKAAAVPFVLYSSVAGANQKTDVPHFDSKFAVEQRLWDSGVPFAILAPTSFMENFVSPFALPSLKQGRVELGIAPDRSLQMVAVENVGAFGVHIIENALRFRGRRIEVASDELTGPQAAEVLAHAAGRPMQYHQIPLETLRRTSEDLARMNVWFQQRGYTVDLAGLRRDYPTVDWLRLGAWAARHDWRSLLS